MTIQQLQYILEVNRAGSVSKAAKNLFVTHSTISKSVAALEEELGFPIFDRNYQGVVPTAQGRKVLKNAAQACECLCHIREEGVQSTHCIRIETIHTGICSDAMLHLLEECRQRDDLQFLHSFCYNYKIAMDKLATFDLDLLVYDCMSGFLHNFKKEAAQRGLECVSLGTIPGVIKIGPGHRLYDKPNLVPKDFKDDVIVDDVQIRRSGSSALKTLIGLNPDRALLLASWEYRYQAVAKGLGVVVGRKSPEYIDRQYGLRNIPLPDIQYHAFYVFNPAQPLCPELQRYIALLEEELDSIRID